MKLHRHNAKNTLSYTPITQYFMNDREKIRGIEDKRVDEMVARHAKRKNGSIPMEPQLVIVPQTLERIEESTLLRGNPQLRVIQRFLRETDENMN